MIIISYPNIGLLHDNVTLLLRPKRGESSSFFLSYLNLIIPASWITEALICTRKKTFKDSGHVRLDDRDSVSPRCSSTSARYRENSFREIIRTITYPGKGGSTHCKGLFWKAPPERRNFYQASAVWKGRKLVDFIGFIDRYRIDWHNVLTLGWKLFRTLQPREFNLRIWKWTKFSINIHTRHKLYLSSN